MPSNQHRWSTVEAVARALNRLPVDWTVCNGVDVGQRRIGRDVDIWIEPGHVQIALRETLTQLLDAGWPSVWYRKPAFVHQLVAFDLDADGPVTLAFDFIDEPDWWTTAGIPLATDPMVTDREFVDVFPMSEGRSNIKTRVMPFLHSRFEKFLGDNGSPLQARHFEALAQYGLLSNSALGSWMSRHGPAFAARITGREALLRKASADLRRNMRRELLPRTPNSVRAYARKLLLYWRAAVLYPPLSLAASSAPPSLADDLRRSAQGTFIDVLPSQGRLRRGLPKRPVSGFAVHLTASTEGRPSVQLAEDFWGRRWRLKLREQIPAIGGPVNRQAVLQTAQWLFDRFHRATVILGI